MYYGYQAVHTAYSMLFIAQGSIARAFSGVNIILQGMDTRVPPNVTGHCKVALPHSQPSVSSRRPDGMACINEVRELVLHLLLLDQLRHEVHRHHAGVDLRHGKHFARDAIT
jgi:hypothetical protein